MLRRQPGRATPLNAAQRGFKGAHRSQDFRSPVRSQPRYGWGACSLGTKMRVFVRRAAGLAHAPNKPQKRAPARITKDLRETLQPPTNRETETSDFCLQSTT